MKITKTRLQHIILEELGRFLEQEIPAGAEDVSLSDEAKKKAAETAVKVKASNATTLASLEQYKAENPNLDHAAINAAIENLQKVGTEVDASMKRVTAESKDLDEFWGAVARGAARGAGAYAGERAAKHVGGYLGEEDYEVFTQKVLEGDDEYDDYYNPKPPPYTLADVAEELVDAPDITDDMLKGISLEDDITDDMLKGISLEEEETDEDDYITLQEILRYLEINE